MKNILNKSFYYLILTFGVVGIASAQVKDIPFVPSTGEKIEIKPNYKPGESIVNPDKLAPFNVHSMDLNTLESRTRIISVTAKNEIGTPIFFSGFLNQQKGETLENQVSIYLNHINSYYNLRNIADEYKITAIEADEIGMTHISVQQIYKGVEVEGGEMKFHAQNGIINSANGMLLESPKLQKVIPSLSESEAIAFVESDFAIKGNYSRISDTKFLQNGKQFDVSLVIIKENEKDVLVYKIDAYASILSRFIYLIDANSGEIIHAYKNYCSLHGSVDDNHNHAHISLNFDATTVESIENSPPDGPATATAKDLQNIDRTINTFEKSNKFYLIDASRAPIFNNSASVMPDEPVGVIWTIDAFNTNPENSNFKYDHVTSNNNSWTNKTAVSAHFNGGKAYEYFFDVFGRKSINGEKGNIVSLINISDPSSGGGFDNAFWNGAAMFYGNGDTAFEPLAKALDVAGHEMSHGVVQTTANLTYQGESGAMNEAFADIFGAMIDRDDWFMGEDVAKTSTFPTGRLRDMSNPHNGGTKLGDPGWQPDHVNEQYKGSQDNGGVHINSGIVNHAYYLFAETNGIGKAKAEQIFYRALTTYLTKSSQFIDLRAAVEKAATDLYSNTEKNAASSAFQAVGIGGGGGNTDYEEDIEMNPGEDFLLASDDILSNLYVYNNNLELIADPLSDINHISRPSVTDDGSEIYFIGSDNRIYNTSINWTTSQVSTNVFDSQAIWRNVAISKDGKRIAAITQQTNNNIIILDLPTNKQQTFELYNPTFTEGVSTGDVNFSDAMEFDFNGEWLMYDAKSTINGTTGSISYWDIGFLNVYDNSAKNFANGRVEKLFNQLPENTSVGNPTFSKNSGYIIAFDLIEPNSYKILGANIEQNKISEIFENGGLGYPSFNNADNQIVYQYEWIFGTDIGLSALESDKISPVFDSETIILETAKFPVVFSNGFREIVAIDDINNAVEFSVYPNPAIAQIIIDLKDLKNASSISISDIQGATVFSQNIEQNKIIVDCNAWIPGAYTIQIKTLDGNQFSNIVIKN